MPDFIFNVSVTEEQQKCIADSVVDWKAWCEHAFKYVLNSKVEQCNIRLLDREENLLGDTVPRDKNTRIISILSHVNHKDRKARDLIESGRT